MSNVGFCSTSQNMELVGPRKEHNERNDCTVVALTLVCGIPYKTAHQFFKAQGRQNRHGAFWDRIMHDYIVNNYLLFNHQITRTKYPYYDYERKVEKQMGYSEYWGCPTMKLKYLDKRTTVKQFIKDNPKGRYVLEVN